MIAPYDEWGAPTSMSNNNVMHPDDSGTRGTNEENYYNTLSMLYHNTHNDFSIYEWKRKHHEYWPAQYYEF